MSKFRRLYIRSKPFAVTMGVILFVLGSWFLFQAWDARGEKPPRIARPFAWW
jgi:hypothetical protein